MARIKIPYKFYEQASLAKKIIKKHKEDGDASILKNLLDMDKFEQTVEKSSEFHDKKNELKREAELMTEKRNNEWKNGEDDIRYISQYLKSYFRNNPHALGKWGFTVDSTTQKKKEKE